MDTVDGNCFLFLVAGETVISVNFNDRKCVIEVSGLQRVISESVI